MKAMSLFLALWSAGSTEAALREAAERYTRGDAAGAADGYETAVAEGADGADVYFNLGTAALRAGDVGRAVWALTEARARAPWDEDVRFNLELAQKQNADTVVGHEEPVWMEVMRFVPRAPLQWLSLGVFLLACALLLARGITGPQRTLEAWAMRSGVAALALGLITTTVELTAGTPVAVVIDKEAIVRSTERVDGPEAFRVHAGLSVRPVALGEMGLVRIRLSNGLEGYVEESAIRNVGGPPRLRDGAAEGPVIERP